MQVFGTFLMDFGDLETRAAIIKTSSEDLARHQAANPTSRLLVSPPHVPTGTTCGFTLASKYPKHWMVHFFKDAFTGGGGVLDMDTAPYNPFFSGYSVMHLTWSYENYEVVDEYI